MKEVPNPGSGVLTGRGGTLRAGGAKTDRDLRGGAPHLGAGGWPHPPGSRTEKPGTDVPPGASEGMWS